MGSWINHKAEAEGRDEQRDAYVQWWTDVAKELKGKDYRLAYDLFTELGVDTGSGKHPKWGDKCEALNKKAEKKKNGKHFVCPVVCGRSLRESQKKYDDWTERVVKAIRK